MMIRFIFAVLASSLLLMPSQDSKPNEKAASKTETKPTTEEGFTPLFDGKSLDNWKLVGKKGSGYEVKDGMIHCPPDSGGNLYHTSEHKNFIFRFEFRLTPGANNGVGIRADYAGDAAYKAMEIQVLDDAADMYKNLRPGQYCGSIYDVFPAKRGFVKKAGEWNVEEIHCDGRKVKVTLNGEVIVDANLDDVKDPAVLKKHPGLARESGHIGFLGHSSEVDFRNIRVKDLP